MKNIYEEALKTIPADHIDHHGTDLYLKVTKESRELISLYDFKRNITTFIDAIDHELWYDIPFAYSPGWIRDPKTGWFPL